MMKHSKRLEIFEQVRNQYSVFLLSVLWKLTGDRELFTEAMQYALLGIWQHVEKLRGKKAGAYIYRIALSANSKAWRNRIGKDGQFTQSRISTEKNPSDIADRSELAAKLRRAIAQLPAKQSRAIVMRYLEQKDYQAIAQKLTCTEAAARSHVSKAIGTLKSKFASMAEREI